MLFIQKSQYGPANKLIRHLSAKIVNILITNLCTLSCGGCSQHCGQFKKKDYYMIDLESFRMNVRVIRDFLYSSRKIGLFGGEPCVHPQFNEILEICGNEFPECTFILFTNGHFKGSIPKNVEMRIDLKSKNSHIEFSPTMVAAADVYPQPKIENYFKLAKKYCYMWANCNSLIYDNKMYFCEIAASFDRLVGLKENYGFTVKEGFDPLDGLSDKDIINQSNKACYRCGWCLPPEEKAKHKQYSNEPTLVTQINIPVLRKSILV